MPPLRLEYNVITLLRELALMEVDSCISSARHARMVASTRGLQHDPPVARMYEQRASLLMDFLDATELTVRRQ